MQTTSHLLMIRPVHFAFNPQTAVDNAFQVESNQPDTQAKAAAEFQTMVDRLTSEGLDVIVVPDTADPHTPDSIFPNNWISFHENGIVCLYPMFAENRRMERKKSVIEAVHAGFIVNKTIDFSYYENRGQYLEGTGSMVLDRDRHMVYACLSQRTDPKVLDVFCNQLGYEFISFHAGDEQGKPIYHTNVMMCVSDPLVIVCLHAVSSKVERELLLSKIKSTGREFLDISLDQMNHFAGNMLQVHNRQMEKLMVMSTQAFQSLDARQIRKISAHNRIVHADIQTIESNGGGSARCMIAEIHLQPKG